MGKRDYGRREAKKPKKGAKKSSVSSEFNPPVEVEVIKKKKRKAHTEDYNE
ncbi:MAG: hypothetical protein J7L19_04670 [Dehalococcoidia bacterium]|nr:hypothetical protein [Dehalococcoidia bacterium]